MFRYLTTFVLIFISSQIATAADFVDEEVISPIRVGVQDNISTREFNFFKLSVNTYLNANENASIEIVVLSREQIINQLSQRRLDLVFSDPAVYVSIDAHYGARAITTIYPQETPAPTLVSAGTLVVSDSSNIHSLHEASGKPFYHSKGFLTALLTHDLKLQNYDVKEFFSHQHPTSQTVEETLARVLSNPEAVALIPTCWIEKNRSAKGVERLRVIEPRRESRFSCLRTTSAYPGWTLSRGAHVPSELAEFLRPLLLSIHSEVYGLNWVQPPDFHLLQEAIENGDDEFYKHLSRPTWQSLIRDYLPLIATVFSVFLGLIIYGYVVSRLVGRRNRELVAALRAKEQAENRFIALERATIVGQMSSVVAHELRQPLTAIGNYTNSLMRRIDKNELSQPSLSWAIERIRAENNRANAIIEHVRNYAKKPIAVRKKINLSQCVSRSVQETILRQSFCGVVKTNIDDNIYYLADDLEIELILSNLIKNAIEAYGSRPLSEAFLSVSLHQTPLIGIVLEVSDNGQYLTKENIDEFRIPLRSKKNGGLGLGISIVCRIVESYSGQIFFSPNNPSGLHIRIEFPYEN